MNSLRKIADSAWFRRFQAEAGDAVDFSDKTNKVLRFAFPGGGDIMWAAATLLQGPNEPLHAAVASVAGHEQSVEACLSSAYTAMLHKAYLEAWTRSLKDLELPFKVIDTADEPLPALDEFPADFAFNNSGGELVDDALFLLYESYALRFLRFAELGLMDGDLDIILAVIRGNAGHYFTQYMNKLKSAAWAQGLEAVN